eukprot:7092799-Lingulodinium_polyedra.AAC.1
MHKWGLQAPDVPEQGTANLGNAETAHCHHALRVCLHMQCEVPRVLLRCLLLKPHRLGTSNTSILKPKELLIA